MLHFDNNNQSRGCNGILHSGLKQKQHNKWKDQELKKYGSFLIIAADCMRIHERHIRKCGNRTD